MKKPLPLHKRLLHRINLFTKGDLAKAVTALTDARRTPIFNYSQEGISKLVDISIPYGTIIKLCMQHEVLRVPQDSIIREALRNGSDIAPRYMCKCVDCGAEYQNLKSKCSTPTCESTSFTYPDYSQKQKVELLLNRPNRDDSLDAINQSLLRCMLGPDDHWLSFQPGVLSTEMITPPTVYVEDVQYMRVVYDEEKGTVGNGEYFCPKCKMPADVYKRGEVCKTCGGETKETAYVYAFGTEVKARFARDEIYHGVVHPWLPYFYGNSLVLTGLRILMSIVAMDNFNYDNYSTGKLAQILVFMGLTQSEADDLAQATIRKTDADNAHANLVQQLGGDHDFVKSEAARLRTLFLAGGSGQNAGVEAVNTMQDSEKMQSLEWWKLWREIINSLYGVQDIAVGAGQEGTTGQNPGKKMDINNNTTEFYQRRLEACWNWVFERLGVADWVYRCRPVEEKDEAQDQAILASKLSNIEKAISLGMKAELTDEGEVKLSGQPISYEEKQAQQMERLEKQAEATPFKDNNPIKKEGLFNAEKGKRWTVIEEDALPKGQCTH